jgi:hypothetical protein
MGDDATTNPSATYQPLGSKTRLQHKSADEEKLSWDSNNFVNIFV